MSLAREEEKLREEFRETYRTALYDLKINSKPIINSLTMIAGESRQYAAVVAEEILQHMDSVSVKFKLPLIYLVDSILKNIGGEYKKEFELRIVDSFVDFFRGADPTVRAKLTKLAGTWEGIFSASTLQNINERVGRRTPSPSSQLKSHDQAPAPKRLKTATPEDYPPPSNPFLPLTSAYPQPVVPIPPPPATSLQPILMPGLSLPQMPAPAPPIPMALLAIPADIQALISNVNSITLELQQHLFKHSDDMFGQSQLGELAFITDLVRAPNLTQEQFDIVAHRLDTIIKTVHSAIRIALEHPPIALHELRRNKSPPLVISLTFTQDAIKKYVLDSLHFIFFLYLPYLMKYVLCRIYPRAYDKLYDDLGLQCKQCGFRYKDNKKGGELMRAHMDWHFRSNRKLTMQTSISRDWFLSESDWVNVGNVDTASGQAPAFFDGDSSAQTGPVETGGSKNVVGQQVESSGGGVPMDETQPNCDICHEEFVKYWDHDAEEWLYRDTIKHEGRIYHRTCFAEASK